MFSRKKRHLVTAYLIGSSLCFWPWEQPKVLAQNPISEQVFVPTGLAVTRHEANSRYPERDRTFYAKAMNNPFISGVSFQINWRDIEPVPGQPDWSKLDELFRKAEAAKKWVHLRIFPGYNSPAWALEGVSTRLFARTYGPDKGKIEPLPMPWDDLYLGRWKEFLRKVSQRYGDSPAFRMIAAAGPTSVCDEMSLPNAREDEKWWLGNSYTPQRYVRVWRKMFEFYAAHFPRQVVSLALYPGLPINDHGEFDPKEHERTKQEVVDEGIKVLGRRLAIWHCNLNARPDRGDGFVIGYNGRFITGFEMRSGAVTHSEGMGVPGNPIEALKRSIEKGMIPNGRGQHVNFLSIYEQDVEAEEMQPVLRHAASLF